jgi:hypothetical protein
LYQPPPGTVIEVAPRSVGVKLHVPARSTEAIAAAPAAAAAGADDREECGAGQRYAGEALG